MSNEIKVGDKIKLLRDIWEDSFSVRINKNSILEITEIDTDWERIVANHIETKEEVIFDVWDIDVYFSKINPKKKIG